MRKSLTIYALRDPATQRIRYVGATRTPLRRRLIEHMAAARRGDDRPLCRWLRGLASPPTIQLLKANARPADERDYILFFRKVEPLLNLTDGRGQLGVVLSEAHKQRIAAAHRGKKKPRSSEHQEKISAANRGRKRSRTQRENIAIGRGARPFVDGAGTVHTSLRAAARALGIDHGDISRVLHGKQKHAGGHAFRWLD